MQRAFLGGIYFIMQKEIKSNMHPFLLSMGAGESAAQFFIGMSAGCATGAFTNPVSAIKYYTWGHEGRTFFSSTCEMWSQGGIKPFLNGIKATMVRDTIFGIHYEMLRKSIRIQLPKSTPHFKESYLDFACNAFSAGVATIASSPFNYVRNIQYATPANEKYPAASDVLKKVWNESEKHAHQFFGRMRFFQRTFNVGWGTARVACGMAVGQKVFEVTRTKAVFSSAIASILFTPHFVSKRFTLPDNVMDMVTAAFQTEKNNGMRIKLESVVTRKSELRLAM